MVASDQFSDAAAVQAAALAFKPQVVFVPHPIQNRTDDEMVALADQALSDVVAMISK